MQAPWDIVIVDEAHHLQPDSDEFDLVKRLAEHVQHMILLSATPDRDGEAAHFQRLQLLDPARFHDADVYRQEAASYQDLADTVRESLGVHGSSLSGLSQAVFPRTSRSCLRLVRASVQGCMYRLTHRS